jgi:NTE family protein
MTHAPGSRPKVALVIGSGGIKCAASIGIWKVLSEENIPVDMVVGCSGGSVFGAGIALGFSSSEMVEVSQRLWTSDVTKKVDLRSLGKILFPRLFRLDHDIGIFNDEFMVNNIQTSIGEGTTFADTSIPFYCVATDFYSGKPVVLSEGSLSKALRVSSGIPVIFRPVEWEGRQLIDGGISNPLPLDIAIQHGADIIIAVAFENPPQPSVESVGNFATQMFSILVNQLLSKSFAYYNLTHHAEIILMVPEFEENIKINDVGKFPMIIRKGEQEARKNIGYLKRLLAGSAENSMLQKNRTLLDPDDNTQAKLSPP